MEIWHIIKNELFEMFRFCSGDFWNIYFGVFCIINYLFFYAFIGACVFSGSIVIVILSTNSLDPARPFGTKVKIEPKIINKIAIYFQIIGDEFCDIFPLF